jgi:predicted O-methyltransferase YrrM
MRQILPEAGRFLALMAAVSPEGYWLEVGASGGLFLADIAISHQEALQPFLDLVSKDRRADAVVVPISKDVLLCRKVQAAGQAAL